MKKIILILAVVLLSSGSAQAGWFYTINQNNEVIAKTSYVPAKAELEERKEIVVYDTEDHSIMDVEYRAGKIQARKMTNAEKEAKQKKEDRQKEMDEIEKRMMKNAYDELKSEGKVFKEVKDEDFNIQN